MRCGCPFRAPGRWRRQAALRLSEASEQRRTPVRRRTGEPPRVLRDAAECPRRRVGWLQSRYGNTRTADPAGVLSDSHQSRAGTRTREAAGVLNPLTAGRPTPKSCPTRGEPTVRAGSEPAASPPCQRARRPGASLTGASDLERGGNARAAYAASTPVGDWWTTATRARSRRGAGHAAPLRPARRRGSSGRRHGQRCGCSRSATGASRRSEARFGEARKTRGGSPVRRRTGVRRRSDASGSRSAACRRQRPGARREYPHRIRGVSPPESIYGTRVTLRPAFCSCATMPVGPA
jgi:hypothetical protein